MEEMMNEQMQENLSSDSVENTENVENTQQDSSAAKSDAAENLARLREARKKAEQERDEYLARLKTYEEQQKKVKEADPEENIDPSDLVEWRHVQKEIGKLKEELNTYRTQTSQSTTEAKLKAQYPDIDEVLTQENIAKLKEQDPELAAMISENTNLHNKASVAYKYIKKMGIHGSNSFNKEKNAIEENSSKPRSSASAARQSPLSNANDFMEADSESRRKQLYAEMVRLASQR